MSLVEAQHLPERRQSPALTGVNNPFRKSQGSPLFAPTQPIGTQPFPPTPPSVANPKNPFADTAEMATAPGNGSSSRPTDEQLLMKELRLSDDPRLPENRRPPPQRILNGAKPSDRVDVSNIFADPPARRPASQRPRRNSDGSIIEKKKMTPEEERKRRERRHREREARAKDSKDSKEGKDAKDSKEKSSPSKVKVTNRRMDVIDKLDVTSIFGTGAFHHDGPFDACNPHRNRKGSTRAPMAAFPKDSANNALGGSGPVKKNIDLDQYHGRLPDVFDDFSAPAGRKNSSNQMEPFIGYPAPPSSNIKRESVLNTNSKIEPVHGDESLGLGTSTFLEGTPAPRAAIERRESEEETGGLTRKRSLAQKIRGVSNSRTTRPQDLSSPGPRWVERTTSPDALQVQSAGGLGKINERDPFFQDYEGAYEKKGHSIKVAEARRQDTEPPRTSGSDELYRTVTDTSNSGAVGEDGKAGGGFLNRVKSLRGKKRPERRE